VSQSLEVLPSKQGSRSAEQAPAALAVALLLPASSVQRLLMRRRVSRDSRPLNELPRGLKDVNLEQHRTWLRRVSRKVGAREMHTLLNEQVRGCKC
jgi:hypothetical protein